jgi:hypothetical protein
MNENYNLRYPIGTYEVPDFIGKDLVHKWTATIEETPIIVRQLVENLSLAELKYIYRPNGWTIAQVVHHMADSHLNAYVRFKLALTEDTPTIKPYEEAAWVQQADCKDEYLHHSLLLLEAIHSKWAIIIKSLTLADYHSHSYFHPASHKTFILGEVLGMYDWHSKHHIEHIKQALSYKGIFE